MMILNNSSHAPQVAAYQSDPRRLSLQSLQTQLVSGLAAAPPKAASSNSSSSTKTQKISTDLTRRLIFPSHVVTPRKPATSQDSSWSKQLREENNKLQLTRLKSRLEAEQHAMEKISGQTKCLEKELGTQETTIRDYNEELNVAEEAARVALVESIGLQRKLCEICRHLEVRAAFQQSIRKYANDFECNQLDLRFMGPPPSSRSTLYDRSMESCNSSVYSQGPPVKTPPKVTSGQPDADDEFWAAVRQQINSIDNWLTPRRGRRSGAAEHPPQGNYQSHTTLIGTSDSRARSVSALGGVTPVREQLQYALEVSSIMCARTAVLISKLDGWFDANPEITVPAPRRQSMEEELASPDDDSSGSETWVPERPSTAYVNPKGYTSAMALPNGSNQYMVQPSELQRTPSVPAGTTTTSVFARMPPTLRANPMFTRRMDLERPYTYR